MLDVEEAAGSGTIDDFVEGVGLGGVKGSVEGDVFCGEVVGFDMAASLLADVLVGGAMVAGGGGGRGGVGRGGRGR